MPKVKLTVIESRCRGGHHKEGETFIIDDVCPPVCHELWNSIYPSVYALLNGAVLDFGDTKERMFEMKCPDSGRVRIRGEVIEE
jgi:uncharacterized repeat protein (TIGR04076 family)